MPEIIVPKLNNNDTEYVLTEWLVTDGQRVRAGESIVVFETSKVASEVACQHSGLVHRLVPASSVCQHGDVIGHVFDTETELRRFVATHLDEPAPPSGPDLILTNAARALAEEHGISEERLQALGKNVVRRDDVTSLAMGEVSTRPHHVLSRAQQAIAAVVTESHTSIPAASVVIAVRVDNSLEFAKDFARRSGRIIGLPELVIKAMASLCADFPLFFATETAQHTMRLAEAAHIGVTVDVGTGLLVPVVRRADQCSLTEIADALLTLRTRAMTSDLHEHDLSGANIMLSLHNEPGIVLGQALIHPGQTAVVCLAGIRTELAMDSAGNVTPHQMSNISLSYDHRVINGRDAMSFLRALRTRLEEPASRVPSRSENADSSPAEATIDGEPPA